MKKSIVFPFGILIIFFACSSSDHKLKNEDSFHILFWNVENFFDCHDDALTKDDEFTAFGARHWNNVKYKKKVNQLWKTIISLNKDEPPALICLSEIENKDVLNDIFRYSPFGRYDYMILHRDSRDRRGIDVALIYDPKRIKMLSENYLQYDTIASRGKTGRDILEAHLQFNDEDFYLFVNHWPSKYGGAGLTEKYRRIAATILRQRIDAIISNDTTARIICCGDFNDEVHSYSISEILLKEDKTFPGLLAVELIRGKAEGTIRYQGNWEVIDHFFVSPNFFEAEKKLYLMPHSGRIISSEFLLETDDKYGGMKPFRTWTGYAYNGGISDHLPIMLEVYSY